MEKFSNFSVIVLTVMMGALIGLFLIQINSVVAVVYVLSIMGAIVWQKWGDKKVSIKEVMVSVVTISILWIFGKKLWLTFLDRPNIFWSIFLGAIALKWLWKDWKKANRNY